MKKRITAVFCTVLALVMAAGFCLTSSAAPAYLEEKYDFASALDEWGAESTWTDPVFCDGLWMFEYLDEKTMEFNKMETWYDTTPDSVDAQKQYYTAVANSHEDKDNSSYYCKIRANGKEMHPGKWHASIITFVCPADGTVMFNAAGHPTGDGNTEASGGGGNGLKVYLDKELKYESEQLYCDSKGEVDVVLTVKEGQKIRFCCCSNWDKAEEGKNPRGSKAFRLDTLPNVIYTSASIPIGNPKGSAPANVLVTERFTDGCTVSWDASDGAVGYNVYVNGKKMNDAVVTETSFRVAGLEPDTIYDALTVTSVSASGDESDPSDPRSVKTKKASSDVSSDPATTDGTQNGSGAVVTDPVANTENTAPAVSTNTQNAPASSSGMPAWAWALIGVGVAAVIVVAVVIILNKKKASGNSEK